MSLTPQIPNKEPPEDLSWLPKPLPQKIDPKTVGLPARPFLYTLDQIATLLNIPQQKLEKDHIHFEGRSIGTPRRSDMIAHNIAVFNGRPDWRVSERTFVLWMKRRGYKYYDRGVIN